MLTLLFAVISYYGRRKLLIHNIDDCVPRPVSFHACTKILRAPVSLEYRAHFANNVLV